MFNGLERKCIVVCISLAIVLILSSCGIYYVNPTDYTNNSLIVNEEQRGKLYQNLNSIRLIINVSPSITNDISKSTELLNAINDMKSTIKSEGFKTEKEVITYKKIKLTKVYSKNIPNCQICTLDLSDDELFEQFLLPNEEKLPSYVVLIDGEYTHQDNKDNYVAYASSLIVEKKRTDAFGGIRTLYSYKENSNIAAAVLLSPSIGGSFAYDRLTLSDYEELIKRTIGVTLPHNTMFAFGSVKYRNK